MVSNTAATRVAGTLRKRIITDISVAMALGTVSGYAWWHMYHVKNVEKRDAWYEAYAKAQKEKDE